MPSTFFDKDKLVAWMNRAITCSDDQAAHGIYRTPLTPSGSDVWSDKLCTILGESSGRELLACFGIHPVATPSGEHFVICDPFFAPNADKEARGALTHAMMEKITQRAGDTPCEFLISPHSPLADAAKDAGYHEVDTTVFGNSVSAVRQNIRSFLPKESDIIVERYNDACNISDNDLHAFSELLNALSRDTLVQCAQKDNIKRTVTGGTLLVARPRDESTIIGMTTLIPLHTPFGGNILIECVARNSTWRRRGVGEALIASVDAHASLYQGCHRYLLTSAPWRTAAHALYRRAGLESLDLVCLEK